jgi:hypothetical protein
VSQSNKTWAGQRRGHYSLRLGPNHHQDHQAEELLTAARTNRKRINKVLALDDRKLFFCASRVCAVTSASNEPARAAGLAQGKHPALIYETGSLSESTRTKQHESNRDYEEDGQ